MITEISKTGNYFGGGVVGHENLLVDILPTNYHRLILTFKHMLATYSLDDGLQNIDRLSNTHLNTQNSKVCIHFFYKHKKKYFFADFFQNVADFSRNKYSQIE